MRWFPSPCSLDRAHRCSTGTSEVTVLARGLVVCNARAPTSPAILLPPLHLLPLVASPPDSDATRLSACAPEGSLEAVSGESVPCSRLHDRAKSVVPAPL